MIFSNTLFRQKRSGLQDPLQCDRLWRTQCIFVFTTKHHKKRFRMWSIYISDFPVNKDFWGNLDNSRLKKARIQYSPVRNTNHRKQIYNVPLNLHYCFQRGSRSKPRLTWVQVSSAHCNYRSSDGNIFENVVAIWHWIKQRSIIV